MCLTGNLISTGSPSSFCSYFLPLEGAVITADKAQKSSGKMFLLKNWLDLYFEFVDLIPQDKTQIQIHPKTTSYHTTNENIPCAMNG
jgi:hypothetical protein